METADLQPLLDNFQRKMASIPMDFKRYLYHQINWDNRIICIKGERGVGKTTLLLQHIKQSNQPIDQVIYASLDDLWFINHTLMELVDWAYLNDIKTLYLDEVHKMQNWTLYLKNIYDSYPNINVVYTSSSILLMDNSKVDLSRRQVVYTLEGLSFREFLSFEGAGDFPVIQFDQLLTEHVKLATNICTKIKVIPLFNKYLSRGYYPFYKEVGDSFMQVLRASTSLVIETDLPATETITFETIHKTKMLLMVISENVPFTPNLSRLWQEIAITNGLGLKLLYALDRSKLIYLLSPQTNNYKQLSKPGKIFLGNTNLMHALTVNVNRGNERETFFANQVSVVTDVTMPNQGDFMVNNKYLFEVGGKKKSFDQVKDFQNSFLAIDDTEIGFKNRIPLWMFGLLY